MEMLVLRFFALGFGGNLGQAGEFDHGHGRTVTDAGNAELHDTGIPTGHFLETGPDLLEKLLHAVMAPQDRIGLPAGMQGVHQGQGDELVGEDPQFLGLGLGRADTLMFDQGTSHILHHGLAVLPRAAKFSTRFSMPHLLRSSLTNPGTIHQNYRL